LRRFTLFNLVIVGIACGLVAVGFHEAVEYARRVLVERAVVQQSLAARIFLTLAVPTVVFVALAWVIRRWAPQAGGANLARARRAYESDPGVLDDRSVIAVAALTPISLGAGAPLGPEGPTVVISSGLAMWIARVTKMPRRMVRGMIPVGTAAGIAAIFNTPITGVVFAMEEVMGSASRGVLGGTIIAAVAAAVVERIALGGTPLLSAPSGTWTDVRELVGFVVIGVAAGVISGGAIRAAIAARRAIARVPLLARAAVGGLAIGTIGIFVPEILGVGYTVTSQFLHGGGTLRVAGTAFAAKTIGLIVALACGVIGGTFAPSLFIGAALGSTVGHAAKFVLPMHIDTGAYALVGMGAFFAGFLRCPISAVLIVVEVTGDYNLVLPLMLGVATSTALSRRIARHSLTEVQMAEEGFVEREAADDPLAGLRVEQVMSRDVATLTADLTMSQAAARIASSIHRVYPVVNEDGKLLGTIARGAIRGGDEPLAPHIEPLRFAARSEDDVLEVIRAMAKAAVDRCAVLDEGERVVGFLSPSDFLRTRMRGIQ
jgi:CIC family chloride channel protein